MKIHFKPEFGNPVHIEILKQKQRLDEDMKVFHKTHSPALKEDIDRRVKFIKSLLKSVS